MGIRLEASIHSSLRTVSLGLTIAFFLAGQAISQEAPNHTVVPLHEFQQGQWVEKVWGDFSKPGAQFVFRIHQDAGYIVFPHVHPIDENLTIVKGTWALGMGRRFDRSVLTLMELGSFGIAPKNMAHFGWSKTDTIEQVHGIGPFSSTLLDPAFELTPQGVTLLTSLLLPGTPTTSYPAACFPVKMGTTVSSDRGEGVVIGARCSPANQITEYWVKKSNGERFWATLQELGLRS
jgi:hypothetical protein